MDVDFQYLMTLFTIPPIHKTVIITIIVQKRYLSLNMDGWFCEHYLLTPLNYVIMDMYGFKYKKPANDFICY